MRFLSLTLLLLLVSEASAQVPPRAMQFRADLRQLHNLLWPESNRAVLAAQLHQESSWNPQARSPWAHGLAQFTPDTAEWISGFDPELRPVDIYNPRWSIRAQLVFMRRLWEQYEWAGHRLDRWAFSLAAYNGGPGWIPKERARCRQGWGVFCCDRSWFDFVEHHCIRAVHNCRENRDYPRRILFRLAPIYEGF